MKRKGVLVGNFEKKPKEVPRSCFEGVVKFSLQRSTNSNITNHLLAYFFWLNARGGAEKSSHCKPFEAKHLKWKQNHCLTLNGSLLWGVGVKFYGIICNRIYDPRSHMSYDLSKELMSAFWAKVHQFCGVP